MLTNTLPIEAAPAPAKNGGMLGKLLKYEFRATVRLYLPLYLVVLVFGLLGRFSIFGVPWSVTSGSNKGSILWTSYSVSPDATGFWGEVIAAVVTLILVGYIMVVMGAFVVHFIITLQRFWKNLMGDEGYLMFTLPVSTDALLWSKAITALVWSVATILVVLLSVVLLCWNPAVTQVMQELMDYIRDPMRLEIKQLFLACFPPLTWAVMVILMVLGGFQKLFLLYSSMAIGHTVKNHKVMASLGGYLALSMVEGIISTIISATLMPVIARPLDDLTFAVEAPFYSTEEILRFCEAFGEMFNGIVTMSFGIGIIVTVATYLLVRYLLQTQLNLE